MVKYRAIIQSRTSSSRLPGKALLPLGGMPSAILTAKRAANTGGDVVLATSSDASDDRLAATAKAAGVKLVRGPLDDVLARYALAARGLPENAIVVRLTGDNAFPDGAFVESLVKALQHSGREYLGTHSPLDGLPYGLSAEAFTVRALREAQAKATTAFDREHVTPYIIRRHGSTPFQAPGGPHHLAHLRCTLDDMSDYERLVKVFNKVKRPVTVKWPELVRILQALPGAPKFRVPFRVRAGAAYGELTLGTAQLGMNYGAVNRTGKPSGDEARKMLRLAVAHGVTDFDTARQYEDSEAVLGKIFKEEFPGRGRLITKLPGGLTPSAVDHAVLTSSQTLGRKPLDTLLLHDWKDHGTGVWKRLLALRGEGVIAKLGASVYTPQEGLEALSDSDIQVLQLPFNILDRRWEDSGFIARAKERPEVLLYTRSALLQGLLAAPAKRWPRGAHDPAGWTKKLASVARELKREGPLDLCLAYVRAQPWLTSVVLGMETAAQLKENLRLFHKPALTAAQAARCDETLAGAPETLVNPALWRKEHASK